MRDLRKRIMSKKNNMPKPRIPLPKRSVIQFPDKKKKNNKEKCRKKINYGY